MGIFNRNNSKHKYTEEAYPVADFTPLSEARKREIAIEYMNGLNKKDLDLFMEGAALIWQGYGILNKVKTPAEKMEEKQAKEEEVFDLTSDDDLTPGFLDLDGK